MTEMMNESSRQAGQTGNSTGEKGRTVQKYVDILTDAGFKAVFIGENEKSIPKRFGMAQSRIIMEILTELKRIN